MPGPAAAAPARAKRVTRRIAYTPELLDDLRHRYEQTPQTCDSIAATGRISRSTLRFLAKQEGWVRFKRRPLELSPAVKLEARLAAAEETSAANSNSFAVSFRRTAAAALQEAQAQIEALKAARLQAEETGRYSQFAQFSRELQAITNSLYRIKRIHGGATDGAQTDNDILSDLDALRDELARTIDALVDEWLHAGDAGPLRREDVAPAQE